MNKEAARLIKSLAKNSTKSEKELKRAYYQLTDKERFKMKQEIKRTLQGGER